jgi:hypothetical protein
MNQNTGIIHRPFPMGKDDNHLLLLEHIATARKHDLRTTLRRICISSATARNIAWMT